MKFAIGALIFVGLFLAALAETAFAADIADLPRRPLSAQPHAKPTPRPTPPRPKPTPRPAPVAAPVPAPTPTSYDSALALLNAGYDPNVTARETFVDSFGLQGFITCQLHEIEITGNDPITHTPRLIHAKVFVSSLFPDPSLLPTVVMVPPIGGVSQVDTSYANELCFLGVRVALLENYDNENIFEDDLASQDRETIRGVVAVRQIVDYLNPIRMTQTGLIGTSAGAIIGSIAVAVDPRINAAALVVGGGNMAHIFAHSTLDEFVKLKSEREVFLGFEDDDTYEKGLRAAIQIEPLLFASHARGKSVWMMIGESDTIVPTPDQVALAEAFHATTNTFAGDHVPTVLHTFVQNQQAPGQFLMGHLR